MAAVSRLLWRVVSERWNGNARLFTLLDDGSRPASLESSTGARLRFGVRLARAQAMGACDWVLYSHVSVAKVQAYVPAWLRRPYGVFIHGIEVWRPLTAEQRTVLQGAVLRVANSEFTARRVAAMHPEIGPVDACPLSLASGQVLSPAPDPKAPAAAPPTVLLVARMSAEERYKGHDELLDAWPEVLSRVPDARLVFAGDGDDAPRLRARAVELDLAQSVTLTGFVPDAELRSLYRQAAVFAMPSRGEGFGLVYLEAMAEGLPCVGAMEDAAGEIIRDGETGFLVPQSDRHALADRLVRLLTDHDLRDAMGRSGYQRVRDAFNYDQFSRRILALIDSRLDTAAPSWSRDVAL